MKLNINDNISITLTKEQIEDIQKQSNNIITYYNQFTSYTIAANYLGERRVDSDFSDKISWISHQIKTIARAINWIIDHNRKFPDWKDRSEEKHYPIFEIKENGEVGFSDSSYHYCYCSCGPVAYLKTKEASNFMGRTHIKLYEQLLEEKF